MSKSKESNKTDSGRSKADSRSETMRQLAPYLNIPWTFAGCIAGLALLGRELDQRWDSDPAMTLAGALFGVFAGFYHLFKVVLKSPPDRSKK